MGKVKNVYTIDRNITKDNVKEILKTTLPTFVELCFQSDCDVIVPVQEEGLSIFLAIIKNNSIIEKEIIPSNYLDHIDPHKIENKKVLLVDASIRKGQELFSLQSEINEKFSPESVNIAAYIIKEGFQKFEHLYIDYYNHFSPNQYDWAKEFLTEYLLNEVFVRIGDPPIWEFTIQNSDRFKILKFLSNTPNSYSLPDCRMSDWHRFTIFNIKLVDKNCIPETINVYENHLIRLLIHKRKPIIKILPLFYPSIDLDTNLSIIKIINHFEEIFNMDISCPGEINNDQGLASKNIYRWVSVFGSLLLLNDFVNLLSQSEIYLGEAKVTNEIINFNKYEFSVETLYEFEKIINTFSRPLLSDEQYFLPKIHFSIKDESNSKVSSNQIVTDGSKFAPEQQILIMIGDWLNNIAGSNETIIRNGLPFERIREMLPNLSIEKIHRAMDRLIDEGVIRPRLSIINEIMLRRTYSPGSESIRSHIRLYGKLKHTLSKQV